MGTNGTEIATEPRLEEEILRLDKVPLRKRATENRAAEADYLRSAGGPDPLDGVEDFALAPLVDKIAYGIARGLIVAVKELENHIATETRKVGDAVGRRLDTFQVSLDDLSRFVGEQRATNTAVEGQLEEIGTSLRETDARHLAAEEGIRRQADEAAALLKEADARQAAAIEALAAETKAAQEELDRRQAAAIEAVAAQTKAAQEEASARQAADVAALQAAAQAFSQAISERVDGLCKELGVQQEDVAALKSTLVAFSSRVDLLAERLDRQAEAVRSMCTAYSQRESELEQLVSGLARLRAFPTPLPSNGL
jgi:chromosome segregation ATPase